MWSETAMAWNVGRPAIDGPVLSSVGAVTLHTGFLFDVPPAMNRAERVYCLAVASLSGDQVAYNARQAAAAGRTQLILNVADGGAANVCGCTRATACPEGRSCRTVPNGCGGTLTCGACTAPQPCGAAGVTNVCGTCTPPTACPVGQHCGTIPDGCGGTLTCGA